LNNISALSILQLEENFMKTLLAFVIASLTFVTLPTLAQTTGQGETPITDPTLEQPRTTRRPRVGQIDASEKEKFRTRYESKNSTVFSFGPGFGSNLGNSKTLYAVGFGYEWEVGAQNAIIAQLTGAFGDSTAYIDGLIGGKYYFTDEDIAPFVKAGFGFGSGKGPGLDAVGGFAGMVGAGVTVFRTSTTHLEIGATYANLFASNSQGSPGLGTITLGILF
jgi:hypothetical protein